MAHMTLDQIKPYGSKIDRVKINAATEEDILRHMKEDNKNPEVALGTFIEDVLSMQIRYDRS